VREGEDVVAPAPPLPVRKVLVDPLDRLHLCVTHGWVGALVHARVRVRGRISVRHIWATAT
jgi:hypothetical protein